MPSILDLVHESASDLKDRARETEGVNVSLTKTEHLKAFADETIGQKAEAILKANSDQLEALAKKKDIDPDQKINDLKESILHLVFGGQSQGVYPDKGHEHKRPRDGVSSHYDDPSTRWKEIEEAAQKAARKAVQKNQDYIVTEDMRPSRETEPLSISPAYIGTGRDEVVVFQAHAPTQPFPIKSTSSTQKAPPLNH